MFSKLADLFRREEPHEYLKRLAEAYDSRGGDADTLQGALADSVLCLHDDAECIDLMEKYLCDQPAGRPLPDRDRVATDLETIRDAALGGAFAGRFAYAELDQLKIDVARWCYANSKPIHREPRQDTW